MPQSVSCLCDKLICAACPYPFVPFRFPFADFRSFHFFSLSSKFNLFMANSSFHRFDNVYVVAVFDNFNRRHLDVLHYSLIHPFLIWSFGYSFWTNSLFILAPFLPSSLLTILSFFLLPSLPSLLISCPLSWLSLPLPLSLVYLLFFFSIFFSPAFSTIIFICAKKGPTP